MVKQHSIATIADYWTVHTILSNIKAVFFTTIYRLHRNGYVGRRMQHYSTSVHTSNLECTSVVGSRGNFDGYNPSSPL